MSRADGPRQQGQLHRSDQHKREQPIAFAGMPLRVPEHAPDQRHLQRTQVQLIQVFLPYLCQARFHVVANCNSAVRR